MGGYFSQIIVSAIYPMLVDEVAQRLTTGTVPAVESLEIPIEFSQNLSSASVTGVDLVVTLSPVPYTNREQSQTLTGAAITGVNLITTIAFVTYTNVEQNSQILSTAALTGVNLITTIAFVSYTDLEQSHTLTNAALTAVTLV